MPYIPPDDRPPIRDLLTEAVSHMSGSGDLTFAITYLLHQYTLQQAKREGGLSYALLSRVRACAQDASDEFYRVVMAKYEDGKRERNGPVSTLDGGV